MDATLTPAQAEIREAILKLCAGFGDDYWLERDRDGSFPHALHRAIADGGWLGIAMPEAYGGSGLGITEAAIIASLRRAFGPEAPPEHRATIILCSHRLAGFPHADLVVVLDRGRVVEEGTHDGLLSSDGLYARICRAQRVAEVPPTEIAER